MSTFKKAFLWTTVPIAGLSIVSTGGAGAEGMYSLSYVAAGLWLIAVLVAIGFLVGRGGRATSGIWAGVAVGVVSLGMTCFANLNTVDF